MRKLFEKVFDVNQSQEVLAARPYGMIHTSRGRLEFIHLRPLPKMISAAEAHWLGRWNQARWQRDHVQLYYNQPLGHRNFLALKYIVSSLATTLATLRAAFGVLDEIARIKGSDAILCEVSNRRITDRIMQYAGFERHLPEARRRHYIRRFYGQYPPRFVSGGADTQTSDLATESDRAGRFK